MYMFEEETALAELRWNTFFSGTPVLEQKWSCRRGKEQWEEWRIVPTVYENNTKVAMDDMETD